MVDSKEGSMKIKNVTGGFCRRCLQKSLPVDAMIRFARLVNPSYSIYKRTGLSEGMPIANQTAARRIVEDMIQDDYFVDFVETLIRIENEGYMGKRYALYGLDDVVLALIKEGYSFDKVSGLFFENQRERISPNWGRLHEGDERRMTVLRLDIAGNSGLVRQNPGDRIEKAYRDLRDIVSRAVISRLGRLWTWEGDGALAAFMFGPIEKNAIYAGMEILHELLFYNRTGNPLNDPVRVRLGIHIGDLRYSGSEMERLKNDVVKKAVALESQASGDSMAVSFNLFLTMDQNMTRFFTPEKNGPGGKYRLYNVSVRDK
jgi:class 3 adenylate cyclase